MGLNQSSPSHALVKRATVQAAGALPQRKTNGKSVLGTLIAPILPMFLTNNPLPNGKPWRTLDAFTNYYEKSPNTGVIRQYDFTISRGVIAPDGYERDVLLVNDAFPAPLIEANWGDTIQVTVHNNITAPEEGTALHWHGFLQKGTPWEDGVPAVSQCPIAPGKSYTYQFHADLYGSTWYHSHYSAQYAGGLFGPLIVYGPRETRDYDIDVGPILLSDWYHDEYLSIVKRIMAPGSPGIVPSDNNLINGKMNFDCSESPPEHKNKCTNNAGISKFKFKRNKWHRLRLINSGSEALQRFSIDGHTMKVIANDFVQVQPYDTKVVTLGIGQRTDVLVKANGKGNAFWMRSNMSEPCSIFNQPKALAAIYYEGADENSDPTSQAWDVPDPGTCANDDLAKTKPLMKLPLPRAEKTLDFVVKFFRNASDIALWSMDDVTFRGNYNSPTLLLSKLGNYSFEQQWGVHDVGNAKSVRVIIINDNFAAHPMHLHGFNMYILHEGPGTQWDGTITRQANSQRRDVIQVRPNGHMVMQFDARDNPGVWPFHCHIAWHVSGGLMVQFLTNPQAVKRLRIPNVVAETCRQWGTWTEQNIPEQIDSGL